MCTQHFGFDANWTKLFRSEVLKTNAHDFLYDFFYVKFIGMTAVVFTYPLDVLRARIAFQLKGHHIYHGGMISTVRTISQQEGVRALYKGLFTSLLGMAPYGGE